MCVSCASLCVAASEKALSGRRNLTTERTCPAKPGKRFEAPRFTSSSEAMRAALRTSRLLARPASRFRLCSKRAYSSVTRCVDASPKDVKRAAAGEKRLVTDASAVLAELASAVSESSETSPRSPRFSRNLRKLSLYAKHGDTIKGFFEPSLLRLYLTIDAVHEPLGVSGALVEIGVYHGKSFIPLALIAQKNERCVAVDCFEDQAVNHDHSGEGDFKAFWGNVENAMCVCQGNEERREGVSHDDDGDDDEKNDWFRILQTDSARLVDDSSPLTKATGNTSVRLFSIDGCHTSEATVKDLRIASETLHEKGVVILDDVFNPDWPGVVTGLFDWREEVLKDGTPKKGNVTGTTSTTNSTSTSSTPGTSTSSTTNDSTEDSWHAYGLEPFAIGFGKVFMSRPATRDLYFHAFCEQGEEKKSSSSVRKTAKFMGQNCAVFRHGWISTFHGNE